MGNEQVTQPAGNSLSTGWFGNVTNNLANLANAATPVVTALTTKGTKAGQSNASPNQTALPATSPAPNVGGISMKVILIGVAVLVAAVGGFMLFRSNKG